MRAVMVLAATAATIGFNSAQAETGVSPDTIVFGQAAVLEGSASALGLMVFMTVIQPDGSFKAVDRLIRLSAN